MSSKSCAHPEVLVDTNWVVQHHKDSSVRIAEVDYDPVSNYDLDYFDHV
jgi:thiosulfate/3-mercaptopyruvate sulfurtransferase